MNKRISKKIYKRATKKLKQYIQLHKDKRTTLEVEQSEHILLPLERNVFLSKQRKYMKLLNEIKNELIDEGNW